MGDFVLAGGTDLVRGQRHNGERLAISSLIMVRTYSNTHLSQ